MAGARIQIEVRKPPLGEVMQRISGDERTLLLERIGRVLQQSTRTRAAREIGPEGTPWAALSPRYKRHKDKERPGVPKLKFDEHMLEDSFVYEVDGDTLLVGTTVRYGAIHQFGGTIDMPARQSEVRFKRDRRTGEVGNRFARKRSANFAQSVLIPAYKVRIPARPWLGIDQDDDEAIAALLREHLEEALDGAGD